MAYTSDNAKLYIAELVMECNVAGNSRDVVDINLHSAPSTVKL